MTEREGFRSRLGFIPVSAGCAIGIGNLCFVFWSAEGIGEGGQDEKS